MQMKQKLEVTLESALNLFDKAPMESLLPQEIIGPVYGVPTKSLEKARCVGDTDFPPFVKLGSRVRYRKSDVIKHMASLEARGMA